ncbi:MAG: hypothetical protein WBN83_09425 [Desulfoprunum sp.]|jgi:hypothetical protein|uniref:hypothetical protein n=1 Tax=Desulfoprunum sp. TaxID=2020866 RepID=UPI003C778CEB
MEPTFAPTSVRITFPAVYETSDDVPRGKIFVHEPEHEHKERRGHPSELPYEQGIRAELLKKSGGGKNMGKQCQQDRVCAGNVNESQSILMRRGHDFPRQLFHTTCNEVRGEEYGGWATARGHAIIRLSIPVTDRRLGRTPASIPHKTQQSVGQESP